MTVAARFAPLLLVLVALLLPAVASAWDNPQVEEIGARGGPFGGKLAFFVTDGGAGVKYGVDATNGTVWAYSMACVTSDGKLLDQGCASQSLAV